MAAAVALAGALMVASPAWAATSHTAYVTATDDATGFGSVIPIDTTTNVPGPPIPSGGGSTMGIAITPDGKTAYVVNNSGTVTPIDTATNTAGTPVAYFFHAPQFVAIAPDGRTAYVTDAGTGEVIPIDTATNTPGSAITVGFAPLGIAITPDGKTAYVVDHDLEIVTPLDIATNTEGTPIPVGLGPYAIAITPDGKTAYVTNTSTNSVTAIDTTTNTPVATIAVGHNPEGIAITPDGKTAYVTGASSNSVTPIDTATNTPGPPILLGSGSSPIGIAITPDGKTAYVADNGSDSVTPIDTATNTVGASIPAQILPFGIAVTPDQAPVARFSSTAAPAGQASSFDASGSSDPDGSIASYTWNFGDGSSESTASATTTHTYASAGNYTVTLTVTDNAGCSTSLVFTGQTVSCNGSSGAAISHQVGIPNATPAARPPSAVTGAATKITHSSARLNGTVNPNGSATTYYFEYGTSSAYGRRTSSQSAGANTATHPESVSISGLASGRTYHFRLVAVNGAGTSAGADKTFTTSARPLRLSVAPRSVRAGARACFAFKATSTGHPVKGATVRFAGHTARTSRVGTATICLRLTRGRYHTTAAKAGFRTARATIIARAAASPTPRFTG